MTELYLFNTLTGQKDLFVPQDKANVRLYVCGPTVYDYAHIGNARPVIVFDVLYRLLRRIYGENHVTYVRNITDVDDKINARAIQDYPDLPLNEAIRKVTSVTQTQFKQDAKALGCLEPDIEPRATEHIAEMIDMINILFDKGYAYVADGHVLLEVAKAPDYGQLSRRKLDDHIAGARVAVESYKKAPGDFVLWKPSGDDAPGWDSPFGYGRPGWHIECSAMSAKHLGQTFDIHGGGLDLKFPHHENEIAQSRCAHGTPHMAKFWMHNGYVQVEGKKMSKSAGNFITIHDLLHTDKLGGRSWSGNVLRLAMLMTHYKEPIDFSFRRLEEAYRIEQNLLEQAFGHTVVDHSLHRECVSLLHDDLNTSGYVAFCQKLAKQVKSGDSDKAKDLRLALDLIGIELDLNAKQTKAATIMRDENLEYDHAREAQINALREERLKHLNNKNWAEADRIRDELAQKGIKLTDKKDPETGERVTIWEPLS